MNRNLETGRLHVTITLCLGVGLGLLLWLVVSARPATVAADGAVSWPDISTTLHVSGLTRPVHITHAGDGTGRLFVVEQGGTIRIFDEDGNPVSTFLDISSKVSCCGEQGLLSVAFPPGYANKQYFYVYYTDSNGDTVVARYHASADPDVADPNSEEVILTQDQPFPNHNGGQLAFSPKDGYLYISLGDGGSGGDPQENAQDPDSLLGKLLRLDVESVATGTGYVVPADNPFVGETGRDEIWALGLRNPWRFSFDRQTHDLYVGDVGQGSWEEVDFQPAGSAGGENYGWDNLEGAHCYEPSSGCTEPDNYVPPVAEYSHTEGTAVSGGYVYRGTNYCKMQGVYFYGDYGSGKIWGLQYDGTNWQTQELADTSLNISSFGEDEAGNLYLANLGGDIYEITAAVSGTYPDFAEPAGIGIEDVVALATHWHQQPGDTNPLWDGRFDLDHDGDTDVADLMLVASKLGVPCS